MFSYSSPEEVFESLGGKVIDGFARSVAYTAADLEEYRSWRPGWVAQHSERGLANWIHDRLWYHLTVFLDGLARVEFHEVGPTREITVGLTYRLRAKRHGEDGRVSAYPTQAALEFFLQGPVQEPLEGLGEVRLIVGYDWDHEARAIERGVLSLRDGQDNLVWREELPEADVGGSVVPSQPPVPGPAAPSVALQSESDEEVDGRETGRHE